MAAARGYPSLLELAQDIGVHPSHLYMAIRGQCPYWKIKEKVAERLGMSFRELWGVDGPTPPKRRTSPYREAILDMWDKGYTTKEIAGTLGINICTVRKYIHERVRARCSPIRRARNPRARRFQDIAARAGYPSLRDVARELGVSHEAVGRLFRVRGKSQGLRQRIAELLGVDYKELWNEEEVEP
jgi:transcriptional regulator with XRE-family HTH domain